MNSNNLLGCHNRSPCFPFSLSTYRLWDTIYLLEHVRISKQLRFTSTKKPKVAAKLTYTSHQQNLTDVISRGKKGAAPYYVNMLCNRCVMGKGGGLWPNWNNWDKCWPDQKERERKGLEHTGARRTELSVLLTLPWGLRRGEAVRDGLARFGWWHRRITWNPKVTSRAEENRSMTADHPHWTSKA